MSLADLVRRLMFRRRSSSSVDRLALCRECGAEPVEPGTLGRCGACHRRAIIAGDRF